MIQFGMASVIVQLIMSGPGGRHSPFGVILLLVVMKFIVKIIQPNLATAIASSWKINMRFEYNKMRKHRCVGTFRYLYRSTWSLVCSVSEWKKKDWVSFEMCLKIQLMVKNDTKVFSRGHDVFGFGKAVLTDLLRATGLSTRTLVYLNYDEGNFNTSN